MNLLNRHLVILSGGMDSAVCLGKVVNDFFKEGEERDTIFTVHFNYGQHTEQQELESFIALNNHYKIPKENRIIVECKKSFECIENFTSLIGDNKLAPLYDKVPSTYVPFRNGIFLSYATAIAEAVKIPYIYVGVNSVDYSGYPDCTPDFIDDFSFMVYDYNKSKHLTIIAPLQEMSKSEIVELGSTLKVPFELTWSCYTSDYPACGRCDSCLIRLKAFKDSNKVDPIEYALRIPKKEEI